MPTEFQAAYKQLNQTQKQAVDTTEGPVLVLAGPGTGKTQLLSTRAAYISQNRAVSPSNILCLTFTDNAAHEMRDRLSRIMGAAGNDVSVYTFHGFGTWFANQYPEQFSLIRARTPLDDLGRFRILESLLAELPFRHPFAMRGDNEQFARQADVVAGISAFKQAGLHPDDIRKIMANNQKAFPGLNSLIADIFSTKLSAKRLPDIQTIVQAEREQAQENSYQAILLEGLLYAIEESEALGKTTPLGKWRDSHTVNQQAKRILKSSLKATELNDLVDIYEKYQARLEAEGRYDYEDMIIQAADVLERESDICLDLAERFQYIMVDEYQDTNGAQNRLLDCLLKANPLDSPNVLVVGDDDQAIMRFQGAEASGMMQFVRQYQPTIITLTDNYRSSQPILNASRQIITQTDERVEVLLPEMAISKQLTARTSITKTTIEHRQYASPTAEYGAVAAYVKKLIKQGVAPNKIAIIGRKHPELRLLVPHVSALGINVAYEKRENILEETHIKQLLDLAECVAALADKPAHAEMWLPQVLAADYWQLQPLTVYQLALAAKQHKQTWLETMLSSSDKVLSGIAEWLIAAAAASKLENFTQVFDVLIGRTPLPKTQLHNSPYINYLQTEPAEQYVRLMSHLICLRSAVLQSQPQANGLRDMLEVVSEYRRSGTQLIDDNPLLRGNNDSVQLMTAHGAKGREFDHVIILSAVNPVWGPQARGHNTKIALPENLPLYPAGDTDSDRLRLLYVAMTRAKSHLLITSYQSTDQGKDVLSLPYLPAQEDWSQPQPSSAPEPHVLLETAWHAPALSQQSLKTVLQPVLRNFTISASALRCFLDICYAGPQATIEQHVLRFPSAYNAHTALGEASHEALHAAQQAIANNQPFSASKLLAAFDAQLKKSGLHPQELQSIRKHGHEFLPAFMKQFDLASITSAEKDFKATLPSGIQLRGKVDALRETKDTLEVIDYKTGTPPLPDWQTKGLSPGKQVSLHFYRQQLLFYKLLLDNSATYSGSQVVTAAELVFVEPSAQNTTDPFINLRIDSFDKSELSRLERLIAAVHSRLTQFALPDVSKYSPDLKGILAFEADLLGE